VLGTSQIRVNGTHLIASLRGPLFAPGKMDGTYSPLIACQKLKHIF